MGGLSSLRLMGLGWLAVNSYLVDMRFRNSTVTKSIGKSSATIVVGNSGIAEKGTSSYGILSGKVKICDGADPEASTWIA